MADTNKITETHANLVCQFEEQWLDGKRPSIDTVLAFADRIDRLALLADLVELDMEFCWKTDLPYQVEGYFDNYPDLRQNSDAAIRLIQKEWELQSFTDQRPKLTQYAERFPNLVDRIQTFSPSLASRLSVGNFAPLSIGAVRAAYLAIQEASRNVMSRWKSVDDPDADTHSSQHLRNALREWLWQRISKLIDVEFDSADKQQALFRSDNRALANELFNGWVFEHGDQASPVEVYLHLAETMRTFFSERAHEAVNEMQSMTTVKPGDKPAPDTLMSVFANAKDVCDRDKRWEQLRTEYPDAYEVNMLAVFGGRTSKEIAELLNIRTAQVDDAIHRRESVFQQN